ncbi:MAG: hypothetical protein IJ391_02525 [Clostridia bacterium]|nr:hypothetical protein [Clostridia bacterium]
MYKVTVPTTITNGHFNKEKTLCEMKRSGAQRIALALLREPGHAFSSKESLELLRELIPYYKENGLEVLVWLGESFGHDGSPVKQKGEYTSIRTLHGVDTAAFCPMDERFISDMCTWVKNVAGCGADMILIDDDFRLGFRGEGTLGCFCEHHMAALEKKLGERITREEIVQKGLLGGPNKYRNAFMEVQGESMLNISRRMREALDSVDPQARLGFCANPNFDFLDCTMLDISRVMAGNTRPFMRLFGAPYWTVSATKEYPLGVFIELSRTEASWFKNDDIELFSEGDVFPRPRFSCSSARLECMDTILRADGSNEGILKYMLDYVSDADYETGYIDGMVKNKRLYEDIDRIFSGKKCIGVRPYNVMQTYKNRHIADCAELERAEFSTRYPSLYFATGASLPISYEDGSINVVFGENARYISADELKYGAIIDLKAAKLLCERGIDIGVTEFGERLNDVASEYFTDEQIYTRVEAGAYCEKASLSDKAKIVSCFDSKESGNACSYTYENAEGMRFLVHLFDAESVMVRYGWFTSYARARLVNSLREWLTRAEDNVYVRGNHPYMYVMAKRDENELAVGLWNLFEDEADNVRIVLPNEPKEIEFINCSGHTEGDEIVLDSSIKAFGFAAVRVK